MRLILMRHGEAEPYQIHDAIRQLTLYGHQQAKDSASQLKRYIQQHGIQPDVFIVSPYVRAQQTLAHLTVDYPELPVQTFAGITPDSPADAALAWLSQYAKQNQSSDQFTMIVVCHMNIIGYLAGLLTADPPASFQLAEVRIFQQMCIGYGDSTEEYRILPNIHSS